MRKLTTRRDFLGLVSGAAGLGIAAGNAWPQGRLPARAIPSTGELLPIVGLGSTRPVSAIPEIGADRVAEIVRTLVAHGGKVVDTWPRDFDNDSAFGRIVNEPQLRDALFLTINLEQADAQAGVEQFLRTLAAYQRESIDLVNVGSLIGLGEHWPNLKDWQAQGRTRYIGVTAAQAGLYEQLEAFLQRESPDFVELNYSVTERDAERRLLPLLADRGIAVLNSRPFMNGAYFDRLRNVPLPEWSAEFACRSWAQFSLQYIFANTDVTCVLTETTSPEHMAENAQAALSPIPDAAARRRMRRFIDAI
jgi:diketogulonate reductase-like aldo/keto reductase